MRSVTHTNTTDITQQKIPNHKAIYLLVHQVHYPALSTPHTLHIIATEHKILQIKTEHHGQVIQSDIFPNARVILCLR